MTHWLRPHASSAGTGLQSLVRTKIPHAVGQLILHAKTRNDPMQPKIKGKMQYVFKNNKLQVERVET